LPVAPDQYGDGLGPPLTGLWTLKSSHVRVAYHIEVSAHEVWILMIADRDVIWDRHEAEILLVSTVTEIVRRKGSVEVEGSE
jgi:hypothetical protein